MPEAANCVRFNVTSRLRSVSPSNFLYINLLCFEFHILFLPNVFFVSFSPQSHLIYSPITHLGIELELGTGQLNAGFPPTFDFPYS